jgi:hypothetical protein
MDDRRPKIGRTDPRLRGAPSAVHPVQILTERFDRVKTPEEADGRRKEDVRVR